VQTCIWPSWCHCHSLSLASVKSRLVLPFWYRLTRGSPGQRVVKGVCVIYTGILKVVQKCTVKRKAAYRVWRTLPYYSTAWVFFLSSCSMACYSEYIVQVKKHWSAIQCTVFKDDRYYMQRRKSLLAVGACNFFSLRWNSFSVWDNFWPALLQTPWCVWKSSAGQWFFIWTDAQQFNEMLMFNWACYVYCYVSTILLA